MRSRSLWTWLLIAVALLGGRPAHAMPKFAREYHVTCQMCHSVPPRLNLFGLAFQANHFNWPAKRGPAPDRSLRAEPLSGILTTSLEANRSEHVTTVGVRDLILQLSDGFTMGKNRAGGYALHLFAWSDGEDAQTGDLEHGWVALPVAGNRGQFAVTLGQVSPLMFQFGEVTSLLSAIPAALDAEIDEFSFIESLPGMRVDFFNNQRRGTANGNYVGIGLPFNGKISLNSQASLGTERGVFAQAFHREGWSTVGAFGFTHNGTYLTGLLGTCQPTTNLYVLGAASIGHDEEGSTRRLSGQAEYVASNQLAFTGGLDLIGGAVSSIGPVLGITWYPLPVPWLRLIFQDVEHQDDHVFTIFAKGQF